MKDKTKEIRRRCGAFFASLRKKLPVKILMWLSVPLFTMFCLFIMEYFNYRHYSRLASVLQYFRKSPGFLFAVVIMFVITAVLLLCVRKVWIATGILGLLSLICAYVNYMKIDLNGDNFYPKDIAMVKSAGELMGFVSSSMPALFTLAVIGVALWVAAFALMKTELPLKWMIRLPAAVVVLALALYPLGHARAQKTINSFGLYFEDTVLQSSNYYANGFISGFALNVLMLDIQEPDGYSKAAVEALLAPYSGTETSGDELFDVIVVLSESFFDLRTIPGLTFSENPLSHYDEIISRDNCYSGKLYATALGGGTVRPEFEILTGLSTDYLLSGSSPWEFVSAETETCVTSYKDAGYDAIAIHPYDEKFYSRSYAYGYAGFDELYGLDALSGMFELSYKRGYTTDASTLEAMEYFLDNADDPLFLFTITMQNHQAYNPLPEEEIFLTVSSDTMEESVLASVTTYAQGLYDANQMLGELVDYVDSRERPTILFFFGDHLPTLGTNYAAYNQSGFVDSSNGFDHEERLKMYSTPFLIYSNREMDISMFPEHTGNAISSYNVMNAIAEATGFRQTPYMELLRDFYDVTPMYNVRLLIPETEEIGWFTKAIQLITYDRTSGGRYSVE